MDNEINSLIRFVTESQKKKELKSVFKQGKWEELFTKSTLITGVVAFVIVIVDFNKTLSLVAVLTFLSFAILFNKPTLFLTSNHLKKTSFGPRIDNIAKIVNSKIINMDNCLEKKIDVQNLFQIDHEKYQNFLDQYIKVPNSSNLPVWEIFIKQIKNKEF